MDGLSKSSSPLVVRSSDGTEMVIPRELIPILSIMVSVRLIPYGIDALKKNASNLEDLCKK